jgi:hypothetical protein
MARAEDMTSVLIADMYARQNLLFLPVTQSYHVIQGNHRIIHGVQRVNLRLLFSLAPLVFVLGILLLQKRGVLKQDVT